MDGARKIPCFSLHVSIGISELDRKRARLRTSKSVLLYTEREREIRIRGSMEEDE